MFESGPPPIEPHKPLQFPPGVSGDPRDIPKTYPDAPGWPPPYDPSITPPFPPPPYDPSMPPPFLPPARSSDDSIPSTDYPIVHGCLLGGAIGDALGAPVESLSLAQIRQKYGPDGVTGDCTPFSTDERTFDGKISEETQLALLTTDARLRAMVRARERGIGGALAGITQETYINWLIRQRESLPEQPYGGGGSLAGRSQIDSPRGVSRTIVEAMRRAAQRQHPGNPLGTRNEPINNSKGSAAVVRVAACGFGYNLTGSFESGCDIAALTHGHPSAWLAAGTFAAIIFGLYTGLDLREAASRAYDELSRQPHNEEVLAAMTAAVHLADRNSPSAQSLESLGMGWKAPEALSMAIYSALTAETAGGSRGDIVRRGLLLAVNHSGDTDATGALCGSLLGARHGIQGIPADWADRSEVAGLVYELARDYCIETGPNPPSDGHGGVAGYWYARYSA